MFPRFIGGIFILVVLKALMYNKSMTKWYTRFLGVLVLGGLFTLFLGERAIALTYQSTVDVEFTFNPILTISLSDGLHIDQLTAGTMSDSNIIDVGVSSNVAYGYKLLATTGVPTSSSIHHTTDLVHTDGGTTKVSDSVFSSLATSARVTDWSLASDNTWGYSYSEDNGTTWISGKDNSANILGYSGLPLDNDDQGQTGKELISTSTVSENAKTIKFKIGAKAATSQASGTYTNVINFYAVANPYPVNFDTAYENNSKTKYKGFYKMQDMNSTICSAVDNLQTGILIDTRNDASYTVAKIAGACWMTQNLRITGTVPAEGSNFSTYSSVNVCEGDLTAGNSRDEPRCHDSGNTTNGVWYNYAAASAKTILGSSNTTIDTENICPANWTLPSYDTSKPAGSIYSLAGSDSAVTTAFTPVAGGGGYYYNGSPSYTSGGYWWSTVANGNYNRYYLRWDGSSLSTTNSTRSYGYYIRCVQAS